METQLLQIVTVIFIQKELILEQLKILKKKKNLGFYKIEIKLFEDFNRLKYVYVVHKNEIEEQNLLEEGIYE